MNEYFESQLNKCLKEVKGQGLDILTEYQFGYLEGIKCTLTMLKIISWEEFLSYGEIILKYANYPDNDQEVSKDGK